MRWERCGRNSDRELRPVFRAEHLTSMRAAIGRAESRDYDGWPEQLGAYHGRHGNLSHDDRHRER